MKSSQNKTCVVCYKPIERGFYCSDECHNHKKEANAQIMLKKLWDWFEKVKVDVSKVGDISD